MSKQGKSVLDGLQKLKEGDASLQAQVRKNFRFRFGCRVRFITSPVTPLQWSYVDKQRQQTTNNY
jgi:hypothetical protein